MKPGIRLHSAHGDVSVVVVRPADEGELTCAGAPMTAEPPADATPPADGEPILIGKRYQDETSGLELLCVKGGVGPLALGGRTLEIKGAKQLPSSD